MYWPNLFKVTKQQIYILVKFNFFTHSIMLPISDIKSHNLTFIKWHLLITERFHCKTNDNEYGLCNIELWKDQFYNIDRDSIIPIHNIYSQFVPSEFMVIIVDF